MEIQPWRREPGPKKASIRAWWTPCNLPRLATTYFVDEPPYAVLCLSEPKRAIRCNRFSHIYIFLSIVFAGRLSIRGRRGFGWSRATRLAAGEELECISPNAGSSAGGCDFNIIHRRYNPAENTRPRVNLADENCEIMLHPRVFCVNSILKGTTWRVLFSKVVGHKTFGNNYENDVPSINSSDRIDCH